jgi:hypothetical protein
MARRGTAEWRDRVREGKRRRDVETAARARVAPRDLRRLERNGTVAGSLRPLVPLAREEAYQLTEALGGPDAVSPQRRVLIDDLTAVGIVLRATLALFLQNGDPELASKVGTLAGARRASLQALGLDRVAKEIDLRDYLEQAAENRAGDANGSDPAPSIEADSEAATRGEESSVASHPRDAALHLSPDGDSMNPSDRAGKPADDGEHDPC